MLNKWQKTWKYRVNSRSSEESLTELFDVVRDRVSGLTETEMELAVEQLAEAKRKGQIKWIDANGLISAVIRHRAELGGYSFGEEGVCSVCLDTGSFSYDWDDQEGLITDRKAYFQARGYYPRYEGRLCACSLGQELIEKEVERGQRRAYLKKSQELIHAATQEDFLGL